MQGNAHMTIVCGVMTKLLYRKASEQMGVEQNDQYFADDIF